MTKRHLMAVAIFVATTAAGTAEAQVQEESPAPPAAPEAAPAAAEPAAPLATAGATVPPSAPTVAQAEVGEEAAEAPAETVTEEVEVEPKPALAVPKISGFLDATYNYNLRDPMSGVTPYHAYTSQHDTVLLNTAHLALTGTGAEDAIAYAIELDIGSDASVTSGGDDDVDLQEAYVAYTSKMGLGLKAGKFVTFSGIEVIEGPANPTISRGFLFGLAEPFTHAGVLLTYKVPTMPELDAAIGVVNGWDVVKDNNDGKTLTAKVGYTTAGYLATLSGYAGPEQPADGELDPDNVRYMGDLTGMVKIGPVDLWAQVNAGTEEGASAVMEGEDARWVGAGLQPVWHLLERLALGARAEVFSDRQGARTGVPQNLYNLTLAPAFTIVTGFVVRGELRYDHSNKLVYEDDEAMTHQDQVVALTEASYSF
jgi:hypothetical protein